MIGSGSAEEQSDELAAALVRVGLVETYTSKEGLVTYRHTAQGARVWQMLAMCDREEGQALLDALLEGPAELCGRLARHRTRPVPEPSGVVKL